MVKQGGSIICIAPVITVALFFLTLSGFPIGTCDSLLGQDHESHHDHHEQQQQQQQTRSRHAAGRTTHGATPHQRGIKVAVEHDAGGRTMGVMKVNWDGSAESARCHGDRHVDGSIREGAASTTTGMKKSSPSSAMVVCAEGVFENTMLSVGWNFLSISTNPNCSDPDQAYAAGFAEGALTRLQIEQHYANEFGGFRPSKLLLQYLERNNRFLRQQVDSWHGDESLRSFWWQIRLILDQMDGLKDGFNSQAPASRQLTDVDVMILNLHGDIQDLEHILGFAAEGERSGGRRGGRSEGSGRQRSEDMGGSGAVSGETRGSRRSAGREGGEGERGPSKLRSWLMAGWRQGQTGLKDGLEGGRGSEDGGERVDSAKSSGKYLQGAEDRKGGGARGAGVQRSLRTRLKQIMRRRVMAWEQREDGLGHEGEGKRLGSGVEGEEKRFGDERPILTVNPDSCSALVKILPNASDLVVSQATWTRLETMLRVYKLYDVAFHLLPSSSPLIPGRIQTFSSYPGRLFSGDDFYLSSAGLVIQETTIGNDNLDLYRQFVRPEGTVLEWMRNVAANRIAASGREWVSVFERFNSGTYNNQWMVVDTNRFRPLVGPEPGTLWVLEQLPGHIEAADMTPALLLSSYWASFNIPFFPNIFNISGLPELEQRYGDWFSHDNCPRAKIFRRDHQKVLDLSSLKRLMRFNDFKNDPLSKCECQPPYTAENAIAARGDLNDPSGNYSLPWLGLRDHAETDVKITSASLLKKSMSIMAISGPTYDQQPPFRWSTSPFANKTHLGHPDLFKFPWLQVKMGRTLEWETMN